MKEEFNLSDKEDTYIDWCNREIPYDKKASKIACEKRCKELSWLGNVTTETGKERVKQLKKDIEEIDKLAGDKLK